MTIDALLLAAIVEAHDRLPKNPSLYERVHFRYIKNRLVSVVNTDEPMRPPLFGNILFEYTPDGWRIEDYD